MGKWIGLASLVLATGCVHRTVVVHERHAGPPPSVHGTVVVASSGTIGWTHVRHVVYTEYYGCNDEELYYLDRTGYDDDDLLVLTFIARRAAVPLRYACFEYNRSGRSLFNVALVFNIDPFDFYCNEVPVGYACPGPYGRAYGYYWRRERVFLNNAECHALVQMQIGVRYYGQPHTVYFQNYDDCRRRAEPHPFRAICVRDYQNCGRGNVSVNRTPVVKRERPWESPKVKDWEDRRQREREEVRRRVTVQREREEEERCRRELEDAKHRLRVEESRSRSVSMKEHREKADREHPPRPDAEAQRPTKLPDPAADPGRAPGRKPETAPERKPEKQPETAPGKQPGPPERKPEPAPERKPEKKPDPAPGRTPEPTPPAEKPAPGRKPETPPPAKKPEAPAERPAPGRKPETPAERPAPGKKPETPAEKPAPERKPERKPSEKPKGEEPAKDEGNGKGKGTEKKK